MKPLYTIALVALLCSCNNPSTKKEVEIYEKGTYGYDLNFLSQRDDLVILKGEDEASQIIVSPKYQGKVFTSTTEGCDGASIGWVNYDAFDVEELNEHINSYGGENRYWIGPEGGPYSIFFAPNKPQDFDHWHTPSAIDTEAWEIAKQSDRGVALTKEIAVTNYKGVELKVKVDRTITMLANSDIKQLLGVANSKAKSVAYATDHCITNINDFDWTEETGAVCSWLLDMYPVSESAITIVPYHEGAEAELGRVVTSNYFGEVPAERLKDKGGILLFKTDGKFRSKIGMNPKRTKAIAANYAPERKLLTIILYDVDREGVYLNQEWNPTCEPFNGDALNAYNDGILEDGTQMGPFLELESCSPAAFLAVGDSQQHRHNVFHFVGEESELSIITEKCLGYTLGEFNQ